MKGLQMISNIKYMKEVLVSFYPVVFLRIVGIVRCLPFISRPFIAPN